MNSTFSRFCIHRAESPIVAASGCPSTSFSPAPSAAVSRFRASKILRLGFIVEEKRHARQAFGRKLSDITLPGSSEAGVELFLTQLEISFLQKLTKSSYSFLTMAERDARQKKLRLKIRNAWEEVQDTDARTRRRA